MHIYHSAKLHNINDKKRDKSHNLHPLPIFFSKKTPIPADLAPATTFAQLPVPKRVMSMVEDLGLKPLKRQTNVACRLWVISWIFMR